MDVLPAAAAEQLREMAVGLPFVSEDELGMCSYVRLSSAYDAFADRAEQAGWPVRRFEGHHLSILASPAEVADSSRTSSTLREMP